VCACVRAGVCFRLRLWVFCLKIVVLWLLSFCTLFGFVFVPLFVSACVRCACVRARAMLYGCSLALALRIRLANMWHLSRTGYAVAAPVHGRVDATTSPKPVPLPDLGNLIKGVGSIPPFASSVCPPSPACKKRCPAPICAICTRKNSSA